MGPLLGASGDVVEGALAEGIRRASLAGEWAVGAQLARELEQRRTARAATNVVSLDAERRGGVQP